MLRTTALFTITAALLAGCIDTAPTDDEFVFGLTADEVLAAKRVSSQPYTDAEWLELHRGPFACAHHGALCTMIGPDAAADAIELGYRMAIDGASAEAIDAAQDAAMTDAREAWVAVDPDVYTLNGNTGHFYFTGVTSKRIAVTAWATQLWPSGDLRAKGECRAQKNSFGWIGMTAHVNVSLEATYTGSDGTDLVFISGSVSPTGVATAPSWTRAAARLYSDVVCVADKESLHVEGRIGELNDP